MEAEATKIPYSFYSKITEKLVSKSVNGINTSLARGKSDYAREKIMQTYCEQLIYLESIYYYQAGIHPDKLNLESLIGATEDYSRKVKDIETAMESEVRRLNRHFSAFL